MQRDINALVPTDPERVGDQSFSLTSGISASTNSLSLNPSEGSSDPPPVPEDFPRDPVPQSGRGNGWPYAPQGWPKLEDKWGWRVGKRASANSLWIDRYITVPTSLLKGRRTIEFASRKSLVEYCKQNFPQMTDPYNIFKAFDWRVPAPKDFKPPETKEIVVPERRGASVKLEKAPLLDGDDNFLKPKKLCRAGNPHCNLLVAEDPSMGRLVCHICCSEPGFCRECQCILCCESFQQHYNDSNVIRCQKHPVPGQGMCGHAAHIECALNSQLASFNSQLASFTGKNVFILEYICRRCDMKTVFDKDC